MGRNFMDLLRERWGEGKFVCVGLDPDPKKFPKCVWDGEGDVPIFQFNKAIIDATHDLVCCYKPNSAFYEAEGAMDTDLRRTIEYINEVAPEVPVIDDGKRADIGNTNIGYVKATFERPGADAITVHPYLGAEALKPFLDMSDKGIIVLCRTSNPGAGEFQDLMVQRHDPIPLEHLHPEDYQPVPLYLYVARQVAQEWNHHDNCALVVGATYPDELAEVRKIVGDMPILIPGIGAQGGDLEATVKAGRDSNGQGMIINVSRSVLYASADEDFAETARAEVIRTNKAIESVPASPATPDYT